jgi:hypothetical protein
MLAEIVQGLASKNVKKQNKAADKLRELSKEGLSLADGMEALQAAAKSFPARKMDWEDSSEDLIEAAAESPRPEYISVILDNFSLYSKGGKESALWLLAKLPQREAAVAYMELLRKHLRKGDIGRLLVEPLKSELRHGEVFFPEILDYCELEDFERDINLLLLCYLHEGAIKPETVAAYGEKLLERYRDMAEKLIRMQQPHGIAWMWEDTYEELRMTGALYLDLLGHFPEPHAQEIVRQALSFTDPRLKFFAVLSLIRRGEDVEAKHLIDIAASAEVRNYLFDQLMTLGKLPLFPEEFRTQAALAESNMVNWLMFPTELGRAPDEIELMHVATMDTEDGLVDYYVFRFRTLELHWGAKDGWMAGVSGPFLQKDAPSTVAYGDTFSRFDPWDSKKPEEHLEAILGNLDEWEEAHADNE